MLHLLVNLNPMQYKDSCLLNVLCMPNANLNSVIQEYFDLKRAEPVPAIDLEAPSNYVFYLPMHAVKKESSSTTDSCSV